MQMASDGVSPEQSKALRDPYEVINKSCRPWADRTCPMPAPNRMHMAKCV